MAAESRSPRDIEREIERERAELRDTIDQIWNRMTFEDAWNRAGTYMRSNSGEFQHTVARLAKDKPVAVALTAVGVAWLLFGPSTRPAPRRRPQPLLEDHTKSRGTGASPEFRRKPEQSAAGDVPRKTAADGIGPSAAEPRAPGPATAGTSTPSYTSGATGPASSGVAKSASGGVVSSEGPAKAGTPTATGSPATTGTSPGAAPGRPTAGGASTQTGPSAATGRPTAPGDASTQTGPGSSGPKPTKSASAGTPPSSPSSPGRKDD